MGDDSSSRSGRAVGSPPDRCTCSTPSSAASANTRAQVAVSSSPALALELERIGAIGALQRAAMGKLGQQTDRGRSTWAHGSTQPLLHQAAEQLDDIGHDHVPDRHVARVPALADRLQLRAARRTGAARAHGRIIGLEDSLRRQNHQAVARLIVAELHPARQPRHTSRPERRHHDRSRSRAKGAGRVSAGST